jgi:hypothetical protein
MSPFPKLPSPIMALNKDWGVKEKDNNLYIVINLSTVGDMSHSVVGISSFDIISG